MAKSVHDRISFGQVGGDGRLDPAWFAAPPAAFQPTVFYSWNEWCNGDELAWQIRQLHEGGHGGFFIHARSGLLTPYIEKEWMQAVRSAVETAESLGMYAWLYDEDRWPSGFASGVVPLKRPDNRACALLCRGGENEATETERGNSVSLCRNGDREFLVYRHPLGHPYFNGTCYADTLSHAAMHDFVTATHERYRQEFGGHFGGSIPGIFTDEPSIMCALSKPPRALPWTDALPERFLELHGYDLRDHVASLFGPSNDYALHRLNYWRTVHDLMDQSFVQQLGTWCAEHAMELTGHFMSEEHLYTQMLMGAMIMPYYRHMQVPGIDHLRRQITERVTAKQCSSVCHQLGRRRMLSELYGCGGQNLSFADRKWIGEAQSLLGVNYYCEHLALFTMRGCRKRDYPPNLFYQQPWWPLNRVVEEPLSRLNYCLSRGDFLADVLVIHPQESAFILHEPSDEPIWWEAPAEIDKFDRAFKDILDVLLQNQRCFDLGDESLLAEGGSVAEPASDPRIQLGQMDYRAVVLPAMVTIRRSTIELLERFINAGGTVLSAGVRARFVDGRSDPETLDRFYGRCLGEEATPAALPALLKRVCPPAVTVTSADGTPVDHVWLHRRSLEEGQLLFLLNVSRTVSEDVVVSAEGSADAHAVRLDLETGKLESLGANQDGPNLRLPMAPGQSHLVLLTERCDLASEPACGFAAQSRVRLAQVLPAEWETQRLDPNVVTLDYARYRLSEEQDWSDQVPVIALHERLNRDRYEGPLHLRYETTTSDRWQGPYSLGLIVEEHDRWNVRVNGKPLEREPGPFHRDIRWKPIDVGDLWRAGLNTIELSRTFEFADPACYENPVKRYGTEIESIYLVGEFSVRARARSGVSPTNPEHAAFKLPELPVVVVENEFELDQPQALTSGDAVTQGLPFYAGRLRYRQQVSIDPEGGKQYALELDRLDATVVGVTVNGQPCGFIAWAPLRCDITSALKSGSNLIELELAGSLRNMLGPHHNVQGELVTVGPEAFGGFHIPDGSREHDEGTQTPDDGQTQWTSDYMMVPFGLCGAVRIVAW